MYSKEKAKNTIELHRNEISTLCQYIFENPELGFNEYKASEALSDFLSKHGFEVQRNIGGLETAFRAEKKERGRDRKLPFFVNMMLCLMDIPVVIISLGLRLSRQQ